MMIWGLLMVAQAVAPTPVAGAEALALGRRLAETGTLATLLPIIAAKEAEEMVAAHPELSATEQAELRRVAAATAAAGADKLHAAQARRWADVLSLADLRVLVAFQSSPAAARYRAEQPGAIAAAMGTLAGMDFKRDTLAAFCSQTGKACAK